MTRQHASMLRKIGVVLAFCAVICFVIAEVFDSATTSGSKSNNSDSQSGLPIDYAYRTLWVVVAEIITAAIVAAIVVLTIWGFFETTLGEGGIQIIGGILLSGTYGVETSGRVALGTSLMLGGFTLGYGIGLIPSYDRFKRPHRELVKTSVSTLFGALLSFIFVLFLYVTQLRDMIGSDSIKERREILISLDVAGMLPDSVVLTLLALAVGVLARSILPLLQREVLRRLNLD